MDPQTVFCHNSACPARDQVGKGNIGVRSLKERRYKCHVCGKTFSETKGTVLYRLQTARDVVVLVVTLLAHGCPLQASPITFGLSKICCLFGCLLRPGNHPDGVGAPLMLSNHSWLSGIPDHDQVGSCQAMYGEKS